MKILPSIPFLTEDHNFIALANSSSDVVIIANMKREILFANWMACVKTGYKERELIGKKVSVLYRKENVARYISKISKGLHDAGRWTGEIEVRKKDGTTFGTEASIFEFYDKNGKPAGTIGVGFDLTQRRLITQYSHESENELFYLMEAMEDGMYLSDLSGTILMCNEALVRMLGSSKEEIIGSHHPYTWIDPSEHDTYKQALRILRRENKLNNFHVAWLRKDKSKFVVSLSASLVRGHSRRLKEFIFTIRDVSELQYVDELQRTNERINRLTLDIQRKAQQLQILEEVNALVLNNVDIPPIFKAINIGIKKLVEHDLAGIYIYNEKKKCFFPHTLSRRTAFSRKLGKFPLPVGKGIIGSVAVTGKMVVANNAQNDPRSKYPEGMRPEREHFIAVPLKGRGPLFGVLVVARNRDPEFIEEEVLLVRSFAQSATVALENARLLKQLHTIQRDRMKSIRYRAGSITREKRRQNVNSR